MAKVTKGILGGVSSLFTGGPQAPKVKAPAVMPTPDDEAVNAARRRKIAAMQSRSGRVSTILTEGGDERLGG